jgi:hypothetical protein
MGLRQQPYQTSQAITHTGGYKLIYFAEIDATGNIYLTQANPQITICPLVNVLTWTANGTDTVTFPVLIDPVEITAAEFTMIGSDCSGFTYDFTTKTVVLKVPDAPATT